MTSSGVEDLNEHTALPADVGLARSSEDPLHHGETEKGKNIDANHSGGAAKSQDEDEVEYEDEDEEEDVDFNPLLKETFSHEASSSLSSEIEGFDADSGGNVTSVFAAESKVKPLKPAHDYCTGDTDQGEEINSQVSQSSLGAYPQGLDGGPLQGKTDGSSDKMAINNESVVEELDNSGHPKKPVMDLEDDGAICMRTRARYSLASFTLDELETFLQETDDDDDLQNVDDEQEYRKFLAAVLQGGDPESQNVEGNEIVDDEDEENDADFELELEEALESDVDEDARDEIQEQAYEAVDRRPKTRQNRRQKASIERNKKLLGQLKRPLRPLLPNALMTRESFSVLDRKSFMLNHAREYYPPVNDGSINGFTPNQIGQLHCLIHEHVQLLIQVFSICVLDPSKRPISAKAQEMILEMLHVRDHVLAWRRLPYPSFCFFPPHVFPSVPNESSRLVMAPGTNKPSSVVDVWRSCPSGNNMVPPDSISSSKGRCVNTHDGHNPDGSTWVPCINDPVLSVLDVAPLRLVGNYIEEVSSAVQDYHRLQVSVACDSRFEKEPLFPLHNFQPPAVPSDQVPQNAPSSELSQSKSDKLPKRTMASALVERAKKQSVAPVPKEIAKLAQRFYPLFNPALYPHKPPPAPVANRVLFTDAEDELLALGLMEYNTDWKAIQQRFLPCKSKHQIFVRQKNRSSSKAPENPIKAVRRMKNSPLTAEEIVRIQEGLKTCKLDWMSIWKFIVPYRDPSLLPRQWRIANGTQKSYKSDANKKAKRRLYELRRRNSKPAASANWHTSSEKEDNITDKASEENKKGYCQADREDDAYVHEAFLADWRPGSSNVLSKIPNFRAVENSPSIQPLLPETAQVRQLVNNCGTGDFPLPSSNEFQTVARSSSISQSCSRAYRARRFTDSPHLVKLAPDLPPVNLPPSVRVMSQSAFKSYQSGMSSSASVLTPVAHSGVPKVVKCTPNSGPTYAVKPGQAGGNPLNNGSGTQQPLHSLIRKQVTEEKDGSDLQMHPLLFQTPEDGHFSYYPLNSATTSSSFNFFQGSSPLLNLTLFHNQHPSNHPVNFRDKSQNLKESTSSFGVDFHPLLKKSDDVVAGAQSAALSSANLESSEDRCAQLGRTTLISHVNNSSSAAPVIPISATEKINELDLDIHLSCSAKRQKVLGFRDVNHCNMDNTVVDPLKFNRLGSEKAEDSLTPCSQYLPAACTPDRTSSKLAYVHASNVSGDGGNRNNVDNTEDQSLPEIVMEQEELSDSEDEIGENVEFECEEMADSEAEEGSDSEPMTEIHNEEEENVDISADLGDEQCKQNVGGADPDGMVCGTSEDHIKGRKLDDSSVQCLDLCSCPPSSPPTENKIEVLKHIRSSCSRDDKSCSNTITGNVAPDANQASLAEQVLHQTEQPNPNSSVMPPGKPRKRTSNSDSRLGRSGSKRRKSGVISDMNSLSSMHVSENEPA